MQAWPAKDPREVLDYDIDWTDRLTPDGDTISSATWTVIEGDVVIGANDIQGNKTILWLSGGTDGTFSELRCEIITTLGRTYDKHTKIRIRDQ